jgi:hypothetical protein
LSDRSPLLLHYTLAHRQSAAAAKSAQWAQRALAQAFLDIFFKELEVMARIIQISALTLVTACWLSSVGCSSSNDPATGTGATAGTSAPAAGTTGNPPPSGGTGGTSATAGGSTSIAGTSAGGAPAAGGTTAAGGTSSGTFTPLCAGLTTAAGPAPTKAGACSAADTQLCYKTCGPNSTGYKSETCTNGAYVEQSGCSFPPDLDASCYKIPTTVDASCPATPPQASQVCTVAPCTPCNAGGAYLDSTGASKVGYCVCPMPGASGMSKWSCASTTAWPCPAGMGC